MENKRQNVYEWAGLSSYPGHIGALRDQRLGSNIQINRHTGK